jgi:hypothetical protein
MTPAARHFSTSGQTDPVKIETAFAMSEERKCDVIRSFCWQGAERFSEAFLWYGTLLLHPGSGRHLTHQSYQNLGEGQVRAIRARPGVVECNAGNVCG